MNTTQRENTELLVKIIERKIEKNEPPEVLDSYVQSCGTYGCVLGDYVITKHGTNRGKDWLDDMCSRLIFDYEFGFSPFFGVRGDVIGMRYHGTLKQRLAYVKSQLEEG